LRELISVFNNLQNGHAMSATFTTSNCRNSGMVEIDSNSIIQNYDHKPNHSFLKDANAGLYAFPKEVLQKFESETMRPLDISSDLLPKMIGRLRAFRIEGIHIDIGTDLDSYNNLDEYLKLKGFES